MCSCEEALSRSDLLVLDLRQKALAPTVGKGSSIAMEAIHRALFEGPAARPSLGDGPTEEDRFRQPYVLRAYNLLASGELVKQVYGEAGIDK